MAGLALAGAIWLAWIFFPRKADSFPTPEFRASKFNYAPGEPVVCRNTTDFSKHDSAEYVFSWRLERQGLRDSTATTELEGGHGSTWTFIAPEPEPGVRHDIVLFPSGLKMAEL